MPPASSAAASQLLQATPDGTNLIQLAFQHNHWDAVPLLIQAGVPWPKQFQPPTMDAGPSLCKLEVSERERQGRAAQSRSAILWCLYLMMVMYCVCRWCM
jgi:hypothetical protein